MEPIEADTGELIALETTICDSIDLSKSIFEEINSSDGTNGKIIEIKDWPADEQTLKRCVRCILPRTYPFIDFDKNGICNYCRDYVAPNLLWEVALEREFEKHRSSDGSPDCLVAFSGGRDSSYGLHLLKKQYKNIITITKIGNRNKIWPYLCG